MTPDIAPNREAARAELEAVLEAHNIACDTYQTVCTDVLFAALNPSGKAPCALPGKTMFGLALYLRKS